MIYSSDIESVAKAITNGFTTLAKAIEQHGQDQISAAKIAANSDAYVAGKIKPFRDVPGSGR